MSEPWIRVYPADMRGDQKLQELDLDEQLMLIHAWDLAKNGPPPCDELRAADGSPLDPRRFASVVPKVSPRRAERFYERVVRYGLARRADDGALHFPRLRQRQALDPTAAERQRRRRSRLRHGESHASVTAQIPDPRIEIGGGPPNPPRRRRRDKGMSVAEILASAKAAEEAGL